MSKLEAFNELVRQRNHTMDFLIIYLKEIHPTDGWLIENNQFSVDQPRSVDDRVMNAKIVANIAKDCPVAVDHMDNRAMGCFDSMPERLYVVQDSKVIFKGSKGPIGYDLNAAIRFLDELEQTKNK